MSLEAAIAQKTEGRPVQEVTELVLDQCKTSKVTGLSKFMNLKVLQLNDCGLTSLEDFPTLPGLKRLELSDNNLSEGLEALQDAALVQLRVLVLAGNKFAQVDSLEALAALPNLRELDMFGCPLTESDDYREAVFNMLPNLKYLDGQDHDGNEKPDDDDDEDDEDSGEEDGEEEEDGDSLLEDSEQEGLGDEEDDDVGDSELGEEDGGEDDDDFGEEGGEDGGEDGQSELGEEDGEEGESDLGDDAASESGDASVDGGTKRQRR